MQLCQTVLCLQGECGSDSLVLVLISLVNEVKVDARCFYRGLETHGRNQRRRGSTEILSKLQTHFKKGIQV